METRSAKKWTSSGPKYRRAKRQNSAKGVSVLAGYLHIYPPLPRPVEFAEEDSLPATQRKFSIFNEHKLARSHQGSFSVRIGVSFTVAVWPGLGHQAIQYSFHVGRHIRISMFVYCYSCGGV